MSEKIVVFPKNILYIRPITDADAQRFAVQLSATRLAFVACHAGDGRPHAAYEFMRDAHRCSEEEGYVSCTVH